VLLLSIPRVRFDKRLGFVDDSFHGTTIGLDSFHVHPAGGFCAVMWKYGIMIVNSLPGFGDMYGSKSEADRDEDRDKDRTDKDRD
jgi:hypothetical protein